MILPRKHNEVRHNSVIFLFFCPILFALFLVEILHHSWFALFPVLVFIIVIRVYVKDKMIFDDSGITFCNVLGREYSIPWSDIVFVEDTYENPLLSRGRPGRIVKIVYKNNKSKTEIAKYDFITYGGLAEFLSFYEFRKNTQ